MTYEELKAQDDWYRSFPDWGDDDKLILDNIKARLKANSSRRYFKMLTDIDKTMQTTSKDLADSLLKAGFPKEKLVVENDERAQIELDGVPYTISSTQAGHSFLYENNNSRNYIDFIHTPADIMAAFIVERYCSANWLEEESQRTLVKYKAYWVWERKRKQLARKCSDLDQSAYSAILFAEDYTQYRDAYISAKTEYIQHTGPNYNKKESKAAAEEKWNEIEKFYEEQKDKALKVKKARERYEKVGKQKREAKKQEILEQKKALLLEYKEKYGVECKFIYVHSPYDPHHRFVVSASEGQVVSFFAPNGFDRDFYDKAMQLVELLNELTATYGKSKVQKKGSLPKEGNQKLQKLLGKIGIARQWQGIYSESQRHYLDDRYKNEVPID